ncbi:hypothetical protein LOTGIDRAFT_107907 [Lottia gigantea]|uniref:L-Fucosyltransferase n=1 Tax=Lottia gigantea TaxID=225164 RepID=V3ZMZ9_LOTGI|nr:hypothetical protein LOTGIDRAFT_107907 [Lottia gigantea]ESO85692.1 hypothetical protein LOTGIDRAFT_107907 [Lottia gigantea]
MPNNKSFRVSNYLQSYKYFEKYQDEVRSILTFRDEIVKTATLKLENLLSEKYGGEIKRKSFNRTLVGVHIRRGDYLGKNKQKFGYKVATREYIHSAMDYMRNKYSNITFIVCSMDLRWTIDVVSDMIDVIIAPVGSGIIDMALLSIMDHTIITVGTYGFWSAWLNKNNGTVIYYKDFMVPNSSYASEFANPNTDTYYPYWIGM